MIGSVARRFASTLSVLLSLVSLATLGASPGEAATFTVNSRIDRGDAAWGDGACDTGTIIFSGGLFQKECTLRAALQEANASAGTDTIGFGAHLSKDATGTVVIAMRSDLPAIDSTMVIDGTTAAGYVDGPYAAPVIALDGRGAPSLGLSVTTKGSGSVVRALSIVGFPSYGIYVFGATGLTVEGCFIGLWPNGALQGNGQAGIALLGSFGGNVVGKSCNQVTGCQGRGNVISGNQVRGMWVGSDDNVVAGNRIGTDPAGEAARGNFGSGVYVSGSDNRIGDVGSVFIPGFGSVVTSAGNLISGNGSGISLFGDSNQVYANRIGTDAAGTTAIPNGSFGMDVNSSLNVIGDAGVGGNLVSGNGSHGIRLGVQNSPSDNQVIGNAVGVDASGRVALPNGGAGIRVFFGGGGNLFEDNVIAGNAWQGVSSAQSDADDFFGNWVGTNEYGDDLGNGSAGFYIYGDGNRLGSPADPGNVIGFNATGGVQILGNDNLLVRNFIGTDEMGRSLGNGGPGLRVVNGSVDTQVGGSAGDTAANAVSLANRIAFNNSQGVVVEPGATSTAIRGNAIHDNGLLPIDLAGDGVTPDDPTDADLGANRLQNRPQITGTAFDRATLRATIDYFVDSLPGYAKYPIAVDFYTAATPDGTDRVHIGSDTIEQTQAGFPQSIALYPSPLPIAGREVYLWATATDSEGAGNTSEMTAPIPLPEPDATAALLAGIGLLGVIRRRRSAGSRPQPSGPSGP